MKLLLRLFLLLFFFVAKGNAHAFSLSAKQSLTTLRHNKNIFVAKAGNSYDIASHLIVTSSTTEGNGEIPTCDLEEEEDEETLRPKYLLLKSLCIDLFYAGSAELFLRNISSHQLSDEHSVSASSDRHIVLQVIKI